MSTELTDLQLLHEVGSSGEQNPVAIFDQGKADGGGEMALAAAGWAGQ